MIKSIIDKAKSLGACAKVGKASDWRSLAWLIHSPQGEEFCINNNYPDLSMWREIKHLCSTEEYGIFIDGGKINETDLANVILVGDTHATLAVERPTRIHKFILMHGARLDLTLSNYAVAKIQTAGDDCEVHISKDSSSILL